MASEQVRKVNYIRLPEPGTGKIRGIGQNMSREFYLGAKCPDDWGGGTITSMEEDPSRGRGVIVIKKSTPFKGPMIDGLNLDFDEICVVAAQWAVVYDKEAPKNEPKVEQDPPAAKPVQQQGQQQGTRR